MSYVNDYFRSEEGLLLTVTSRTMGKERAQLPITLEDVLAARVDLLLAGCALQRLTVSAERNAFCGHEIR
jgi:hypothetical protein